MAFTLPPLPYAYDALEPAIDKETMQRFFIEIPPCLPFSPLH